MVKLLKILLGASLCVLLFATLGVAQSSKDHALAARATWSAFQCSSLASTSGDASEQERLFMFGYEQGHKFIAAMKAKLVQEDDVRSVAPLVLLLLLKGPTADFMLGRVYEAAQEAALEDVLKSGPALRSPEEQKSVATGKFAKLNCQLIGARK